MGCIIGNVVGRMMARCPDMYHGTAVLIDISSLSSQDWGTITRDIIQNLAHGGGAIDWHMGDTGIVRMWLHMQSSPPSSKHIKFISCVLTHTCPHETSETSVLSIQMRDGGCPEYTHRVGVTSNGMWLAYPRRYCDNCDCGHAAHHKLQEALHMCGTPMYDQHTVFDQAWFTHHAS